MTQKHQSAASLADALFNKIGDHIVLGLPVGIGKAVHVADALYQRAAADQSLSLTIFTGLTLEVPKGRSPLERRFLEPLVERLYADWPTPAYAEAVRQNQLPPNIEVREFYMRPGAYLGNATAQQSYTSVNYSRVARELRDLGVNVIAQLIASRPETPGYYSLSSNPEITLDLLPYAEARRSHGLSFALVGQTNPALPWMTGDADISEHNFDYVLDSKDCHFPLFGLPNRAVSNADYATAMHVASLVSDGGTLQVGIGSLSDAVAHCLKIRHEDPELFLRVLEWLPGGVGSSQRSGLPLECRPFDQGLFVSSELLSDALFALFEAGLIKRPADNDDSSVIHAGFFVGSSRFYEGLRSLDEAGRALIQMKSISDVNTLYGDEDRKRAQRRNASFVNETMMVTLLGAAVSDALEDGRVVSGVGGQFDFVSMAQDLPDAKSVLMVRARRVQDGVPRSNIRWSYGHVTVPRHFRDVFVSEYGIASTRGQKDRQVIETMMGIADAEFLPELLAAARQSGKISADYVPDQSIHNNTPNALDTVFNRPDVRPHFPPYPLGSELTETERDLVAALEWLRTLSARPWSNAIPLAGALMRGGSADNREALKRMALAHPRSIKERVTKRILEYALERTAV